MIKKSILASSAVVSILLLSACGVNYSTSSNPYPAGTTTPIAETTATTTPTVTPTVTQTVRGKAQSKTIATTTTTPKPTDNPQVKQDESTSFTSKPIQVSFPKGATSTTLKNSVIRGDRNTYMLYAKQGQLMNLKISSLENNAVFDLIAPDGKPIKQEIESWSGKLPSKGDYRIIVGGTRGNATYNLQVEIK